MTSSIPILQKLEELAKAATPGPWAREPDMDFWIYAREVNSVCKVDSARPDGDADFIASLDPQTVQALIDVVRKADTYQWLRKQPGLTEEHQRSITDAERQLQSALTTLKSIKP